MKQPFLASTPAERQKKNSFLLIFGGEFFREVPVKYFEAAEEGLKAFRTRFRSFFFFRIFFSCYSNPFPIELNFFGGHPKRFWLANGGFA